MDTKPPRKKEALQLDKGRSYRCQLLQHLIHEAQPLRGRIPSSPWSQCFSRSYASVLPTSLGHMYSIDQRLFTSESGCGSRYGQSMREATYYKQCYRSNTDSQQAFDTRKCLFMDLRQGFHKNSQGTSSDTDGSRTAFSRGSEAFLHLK